MFLAIVIIFLIVLIIDIAMPYIIAIPYHNYSHRHHLTNELCSNYSPHRYIYISWIIFLCIVFNLFGYVFYINYQYYFPMSSIFIWILLSFYSIANACISIIFTLKSIKINALISNIYRYLQYVVTLTCAIIPLILGIIQFNIGSPIQSLTSFIFFTLAIIFFTFFTLGDKYEFRNTIFASSGLWQRLIVISVYISMFIFALKIII